MVQIDLTVSLSDPRFVPGSAAPTGSLTEFGNADVTNASSDNVEAPTSTWTMALNGALGPWVITETSTSPLNHVWFGPDLGTLGNRYLISPDLNVGAGAFSFSFNHRYSFEADTSANYDGGVIELSTDGGTTWTDIGAGYNGTISDCCGNPLANSPAYTGESAGYPAFANQVISLGTTYAGQTVKVRFRIAEDEASGAPGWDIDDLVFSGLTNAPFTSLSPDSGCAPVAPVTSTGTK